MGYHIWVGKIVWAIIRHINNGNIWGFLSGDSNAYFNVNNGRYQSKNIFEVLITGTLSLVDFLRL